MRVIASWRKTSKSITKIFLVVEKYFSRRSSHILINTNGRCKCSATVHTFKVTICSTFSIPISFLTQYFHILVKQHLHSSFWILIWWYINGWPRVGRFINMSVFYLHSDPYFSVKDTNFRITCTCLFLYWYTTRQWPYLKKGQLVCNPFHTFITLKPEFFFVNKIGCMSNYINSFIDIFIQRFHKNIQFVILRKLT